MIVPSHPSRLSFHCTAHMVNCCRQHSRTKILDLQDIHTVSNRRFCRALYRMEGAEEARFYGWEGG